MTPNAFGSPSNYPILTSASSTDGSTTIQGDLNHPPNVTGIAIEFFANTVCDGSGNGEGAIPIGSTTVNTDASGYASFSAVLPGSLEAGTFVTSTASKDWIASEFSACEIVMDGDPSLQVVEISPRSGNAAGGTTVTVTGTGFLPGATLTIGGSPAGNVAVVDSSSVTATTPALPPGTLNDVSVVNPPSGNQPFASATLSAGWMSDFVDVSQDDISTPPSKRSSATGSPPAAAGVTTAATAPFDEIGWRCSS